jgi:4-amino-4-deoxy-L-arabinose transferase-like glycosyltransferase
MVDEGYYWIWSRQLAAGYYDHPPLVAYLIRLGTLLAGDTEFGVRVLFVLMAVPMSFAVYRAGVILLGSVQAGVTAAIMLNATMMVSVGTLMASPDAPLMLAVSLTLLALAKVWQSGNGAWWLLAGASAGLAMLSKLNGLVLGPVILIWLVAVRELRAWFASPWPYLGGAIALAMFIPTLVWNAQHEWISFSRQLSRAVIDGGLRPKFLAEFVGGQILLATPAVYLLGVSGLYALIRRPVVKPAAAWLIDAMVWPITLYFVIHALRGGVHPNWLAQIYPAFVIAAALAVHHVAWPPFWQRLVDWSNRSGAIVGIALFTVVFVQIDTGWFSASRKDPLAHVMAVGFRDTAADIDRIRGEIGASCVITSDFGTTSWLAFYRPGLCIVPGNQKRRWDGLLAHDRDALKGRFLFVATDLPAENYELANHFDVIRPLQRLTRVRAGTTIQSYELVLVESPKGGVFTQTMPE